MDKAHIAYAVKQSIHEIDPNAEIILFGSRAHGDHQPDSDWDFLILTEKPLTKTLKADIRKAVFYLELENEQAISTIIEQKDRWPDYEVTPLYKNVGAEGIVL